MLTGVETILQFSSPNEVPVEMCLFLLPKCFLDAKAQEMQSPPAVPVPYREKLKAQTQKNPLKSSSFLKDERVVLLHNSQ